MVAPANTSSRWRDRYRAVMADELGSGAVVVVELALPPTPPGSRVAGATFRAAVLGLGPPLVVVDHEGTVAARSLEVRSSGLWADLVCETPLRHWSYGLEAFALAIDEPTELLSRARGDRVPLGWELDVETVPPRADSPSPSSPSSRSTSGGSVGGGSGSTGSELLRGRGHGLVFLKDRTVEIEGPALRAHQWGVGADGPDLVLDVEHPADPSHAVVGPGPVALPGPHDVWWITTEPRSDTTRRITTSTDPPPT